MRRLLRGLFLFIAVLLLAIACLLALAAAAALLERGRRQGPGLFFADVEFLALGALAMALPGGLLVWGARRLGRREPLQPAP